MKEAQYRVIEHKSDKFSIELDGVVVEAVARGRLKRDGEILVGDFVVLDENMTEPVIARVAPRRNSLVRPGVANIDLVVIVVAPVPETDGFLVDKLIVNCKEAGIDCLICLNKSDIANTERERLVREYGTDVAGVVVTAAINGEAAELKPYLTGKVVCLPGSRQWENPRCQTRYSAARSEPLASSASVYREAGILLLRRGCCALPTDSISSIRRGSPFSTRSE